MDTLEHLLLESRTFSALGIKYFDKIPNLELDALDIILNPNSVSEIKNCITLSSNVMRLEKNWNHGCNLEIK